MATLALLLMAVGCLFFLAGSVGMLRLPDALCRLHAVTKADSVGLGLIVLGLVLQAESAFAAAELVLVWVFVLASSSVSCHLIARSALRRAAAPTSTP